MIGNGKQVSLGNLKALVSGVAVFAKQYLDRILTALARFAQGNQIVAERVQTQIQHWSKVVVPADLTSLDLVQPAFHPLTRRGNPPPN
jgi:hypothetical protein